MVYLIINPVPSAMLILNNLVFLKVDIKATNMIVFLDMTRAFDCVPRTIVADGKIPCVGRCAELLVKFLSLRPLSRRHYQQNFILLSAIK